jgi:hypothetical protein
VRAELKAKIAKQTQEAAFVGYSSNADGAKAHTLHAVEGKQGKLKLVAQFKAPTALKFKAPTALQVQRQIEEVARQQMTLETTAVAMAPTGASNVAGAKDAGDAAAAEEPDVASEPEGRQDGNEEAADQGDKSEGDDNAGDDGGRQDREEEPGGEDEEEEEDEEEDGEDEEDEEDDTPEGKELRAKSKQAKLKGIIKVKREAAGQQEGEPDSEEDNRKQEVQEDKKKEGEDESAAEATKKKKKDSPSQSSSSDESSDAEGKQVTLRHPTKRNMLDKKAEHARLWGSDSADEKSHVDGGSE